MKNEWWARAKLEQQTYQTTFSRIRLYFGSSNNEVKIGDNRTGPNIILHTCINWTFCP